MRIALNAHLISDQESYRGAGVNNYGRQLLGALGQLVQEGRTPHRLIAFVHAHELQVAGIDLVRSHLPLERPLARVAWEQTLLPLHLITQRADVVHGLVNVLPLATRTPGVVTVHDLSFVHTPQSLPPLKRVYQTRLCAASVARARRVIAVSRQTAEDVERWLGVPPAKITVIPNGVAPTFTPGDAAAAARFRQAKGLPARYLLYLGTLEPRKNLELLVRAFARWRAQAPPADQEIALVLAGGKGWYYDTIFRQVEAVGLQDLVRFAGFVPAAELPDWYRAAHAFLYPSLFEGFGLPVLEAMACGLPVLCSQSASLLEVTGDAALTFPADDEEALAQAIALLAGQPALLGALCARGLAQAARFSWRRAAEELLAVYEQIGGAHTKF